MLKRLAHVVPVVLLSACGGGGGGSIPTSTTPPTTMPACVRTTVYENSGALPAQTFFYLRFSTTSIGRLDVTVDWTFPATPIAIFMVNADTCTIEQLTTATCAALVGSESGPKPRRLSHFNAAAGSYALLIINTGSVDDSGTAQVVLSSPTCPSIGAASVEQASVPTDRFRHIFRRSLPGE